jgi:uncharacterized protein YggU (UPF0235/DUF167 family)
MARGGIADLSHRAVPGSVLAVRVTPRSRRTAVEEEAEGTIAVHVTAPPADGAANAAVRAALAEALGIAPSRLTLVSGAGARLKRFRVAGPDQVRAAR